MGFAAARNVPLAELGMLRSLREPGGRPTDHQCPPTHPLACVTHVHAEIASWKTMWVRPTHAIRQSAGQLGVSDTSTVLAATTITATVCVPQSSSDRGASGGVAVAVMLIARFDGDVDQLRRAYDRAHALIMSRGGAAGVGELRHHCAIGQGAYTLSASGSQKSASVHDGPARSSKMC